NPQSLTLQGAGTTHAGTLELQAGAIQNHTQLIANQLNAEADTLTQSTSGELVAQTDMSVQAETIDNSGKLVSAGTQTLHVTGQLSNQGA
ncbi:hypothetical protein, partial [Photobacterium sp. R1]